MTGIPSHIKAIAEFSPVEDVILPILRQRLEPEIPVGSLIAMDQTFPFVLVRRGRIIGNWNGDPRFTDSARVDINCFVEGVDADEDAAILAEAIRVILRDAWLNQIVVPGRGHIILCTLETPPRRAPDWATATGPVQYADLPTGVIRYEASYHIGIRKPAASPYAP
jgi:hypothetical protein